MKHYFTLLMLLLLFAAGCSSVKNGRERVIKHDAEPPDDYRPVFITQTANFDENKFTSPNLDVSGIDARQPNLIKARLHITKNDNTYLSGITEVYFKDKLCYFIDSTQNGEIQIKNYSVREITDNDDQPYSVALVLDHSGSMGDWRAYAVQDAAEKFINSKRDMDFVSVIKYDQKSEIECPLTRDKNTLLSNLQKNGLQGFGGMTAIGNALHKALTVLDSANYYSSKSIIIFTDGWDNSSTIPTDSIVNKALAANISINAVDFGESINPGYMQKIAESTGGTYHHIYKTSEFDSVFKDLYFRLNNYYLVEYNTSVYGPHKVRLKLCLPKDTLHAEGNYDNTPNIGAVCMINVPFEFDKAVLQKSSDEALETVASLLKYYPGMKIEVRGHTDSLNGTKDPDYNLKLSQKRADAVRNALIKKGIDSGRISAVGYGDKMPIADNGTDKGRAKNRRTEFIIVSK